MPDTVLTDDALVQAMSWKDESALGQVIDRYTAYVWTIVWSILRGKLDEADAKEIVSEVFYALWRNAAMIQTGKLRPYLSSIARSRAVDALRKVRPALSLEDDVIEVPAAGPETEAIRREEYQALRRALDGLPEPDRTIFIRHYYLYQATAEIAGALGMNVNTVQSKLRRGRERLRRELTKGGYFIE